MLFEQFAQRQEKQNEFPDEKHIFRRLFAVGIVLANTLTTSSPIEYSHDSDDTDDKQTLEVPDVAGQECISSQNVLSIDERADVLAKKIQFDQTINLAHTTFEIEQLIMGASIEHDGVRYMATDNRGLVPVTNLIADLHEAEERIYDIVDNMDNVGDIALMEIPLSGEVRAINSLKTHFSEQLRNVAQLSFQYNNPTHIGSAEQGFSSIEMRNVYGYEYKIHTLDPRKLDIEADGNPKVLVPGFATSAETYERMAVDLALKGNIISVVDIPTVDIDVSNYDQKYEDLPQLPQAYAVVADDSIDAVSGWTKKDVGVIAYSLGTIGATAAVAQGHENVDSLILINPVGLYDEHMSDISQGVRLVMDTLRKHNAQVAEQSNLNDYTRSIHEDITKDVGTRFDKQLGNSFKINMFKLASAFQIAESDVAQYLKKVDIPTTILAYNQDAMAPFDEIQSSANEAGVAVYEMYGSHSSMKYQPGQIAYMIDVLSM